MEALLLPVHAAYVLPVMQAFGGYNPAIMLGMLVSGTVIAMLCNALLGRVLSTCRKRELIPGIENDITAFGDKITQRFGFWLLLALIWIPTIGALFAAVGGFFKIPFKHFLLAGLLNSAAYYGYQIFLA
ncbi:MAG: hypothetical protein K0R63_1497 [Rickettsiales bacterium]|nr:hypothetical protein [Rickettsiales bacterium]